MNDKLKKAIRDEKGKVLVLVLVLLVVGGLVLAPLLGLMSTGLAAGQVYEKKAAELYAADAGVEDAIWKIQNPDVAGLPPITCGDKWEEDYPPYCIEVNGKIVEVVIEYLGATTHRITSIATGDGGRTQVEAYVTVTTEYLNYSGMMDHIITINDMLTDKELEALERELAKVTLACHGECAETCEDGCGGIYDWEEIPEGCYGCGAVYNYPDALWPQAAFLIEWYSKDVEGQASYPYDTIDLAGVDRAVGPLYRDGILNIYNSSNTPATLNLTGTLYITGDTWIGTEKQDFTLDLNGNTIFVESGTADNKNALLIGDRCTIIGPGAIVAIGNIYFAPKGDIGGNEEGVFLFSVSATTALQPSGNLYGSVAGNWYVEVKSGTEPTLTYPPGGLGDLYNFPSLFEVNRECDIVSWSIK